LQSCIATQLTLARPVPIVLQRVRNDVAKRGGFAKGATGGGGSDIVGLRAPTYVRGAANVGKVEEIRLEEVSESGVRRRCAAVD